LVELHGGTVSVASDGKGRGTTFAVLLPVASDDTRQAPQVGGALLSDSALAGLVILVVDDEPDSRELMGRVLSESQAKVRLAASAEEALAELEREPAHVMVSDIGMPGTDGYELMRAVRKRVPAATMPAVAVTAFARADDRLRALDAGFQLHVSKPINPSGLRVAIAALTGRGAAPRHVA
jgi:CheY-like chemotaxis protein